MPPEVPTVTLDGPLDLELPNGSTVRVRPGPYGKGIAIVHVRIATSIPPTTSDGSGKPGRKPRPSTIELREKLIRDNREGNLQGNPFYVRWLIERDAAVSLPVARQTVYRERKRIL